MPQITPTLGTILSIVMSKNIIADKAHYRPPCYFLPPILDVTKFSSVAVDSFGNDVLLSLRCYNSININNSIIKGVVLCIARVDLLIYKKI